jgi:hypothetical protein
MTSGKAATEMIPRWADTQMDSLLLNGGNPPFAEGDCKQSRKPAISL